MILDTIVEQKRQEVDSLKRQKVGKPDCQVDPPRGFQKALTGYGGLSMIAEAKKASPSKGVICADFDPVKIALSYEQGGAQAISILTDEKFFQGSLDYIPIVRQAVKLPVIRKDFIIDELQILQAGKFGADAILLIAAILVPVQIRDYLAMAKELGMDVLVEVHDEQELETSLTEGSQLIGINNRNLRDFTVDLQTTFRLQKEIPAHIPVVSESGIKNHEDMKRLADHGVAAVLVGESLMRAADRSAALHELRGAL